MVVQHVRALKATTVRQNTGKCCGKAPDQLARIYDEMTAIIHTHTSIIMLLIFVKSEF